MPWSTPCASRPAAAMLERMWTLLIVLLVLWLGMSVLGFVVKGLLWLAVLGIVLFLATLVFGFIRKGRTDT
mgnify:CR=1 FL=1